MKQWKPDIKDVSQQIPTFKILKDAVWELYKRNIVMHPREVLKDSHGTYGYRYNHFIIVAKDYMYGNIISCHREAVLKASLYHIQIMMWIDQFKKFYVFDPEDILKDNEGTNWKGSSEMLNFSIKLGKLYIEV
jgi:hypothetical protein